MNGRPGVAYPFWRHIEDIRVGRGWTKVKVSERSGIGRNTIDNLETSSRPPLPRIVHALADALDIPRLEAEELAGLRRPQVESDSQVVRAIESSAVYNDAQKRLLLDLIETLDQANGRPATVRTVARPDETSDPKRTEAR